MTTIEPMIVLERNPRGGWRVTHGPTLLFLGGRVAAKKYANHVCREHGLTEWYNRKESGELVAIPA